MAANSGEKGARDGRFPLRARHEQVHVTKCHERPKRPNCGNDRSDTRDHEPGNGS